MHLGLIQKQTFKHIHVHCCFGFSTVMSSIHKFTSPVYCSVSEILGLQHLLLE